MGVERFERFGFSVPAVPLEGEFRCFSTFQQKGMVPVSVSGKQFWRPVPLTVSAKKVPTVPVSGSHSVLGPPELSSFGVT